MTEEIVHVPEEHVKLGMLDVAPEQVVNRATKIANALADVIKQKGLSTRIRQKDYVRVEGWSTLGAMIGVLPKEKHVNPIDNGYEAYVDLVRASDGVVIGGASAICTRDEKNWKDRDEFAVRSMAITRATGKAYRLGMAWIMELAGYAGTPAEEMYGILDDEDVVEGKAKEVTPKKSTNKQQPDATGKTVIRVKNQWEDDVIQTIMDLGLAKARKHVVNRLNPSIFMTTVSYGDLAEQDAVAYMLAWDYAQGNHPEEETEERAARVDNSYIEFTGKAAELLLGGEA